MVIQAYINYHNVCQRLTYALSQDFKILEILTMIKKEKLYKIFINNITSGLLAYLTSVNTT